MNGEIAHEEADLVEQLVIVPKQPKLGLSVAELMRQVGISDQTVYLWMKQYAATETDHIREFKQLAEENDRLKELVAELSRPRPCCSMCWQESSPAQLSSEVLD